MRRFGWSLIILFGGAVLYLFIDWAVGSLDGYYLADESSAALAVTGVLTLLASIPIGVGVWMVRRGNTTRLRP